MKKLFVISFILILPFINQNIFGFDFNTTNRTSQNLDTLIFQIENEPVNIGKQVVSDNLENKSIEILKAILEYKQNNFSTAFDYLNALLPEFPKNLKFYEYLSKAAIIEKNADELINKINSKKNRPEINFLIGLIEFQKTNYESAAEHFENASIEINQPAIMIWLADSYRRLGNYEQANEILNSAIKGLNEENPFFAKIKIAQGSLLYLSGNYEKAGSFYKQGLAAANKSNFNIEIIKANLNLGMISDLYGDTENSRKLFSKAYILSKKISHQELAGIVLSEWAVSFTYTNQPIEARKKYEESLEILELFKNKERIALTLNNIASLFLNIGNYGSALDNYNKALEYSGEDARTRMLTFRGFGDVHTNMSNFAKAIEFYNKAKTIAKNINDLEAEANINIGMGVLFFNLQKFDPALKLLFENYDQIDEGTLPYLKAELNQKIGIIYSSLKNFNDAEKYLRSAIKISDKYSDIYASILSKTYLAFTLVNKDKLFDGIKLLSDQLKLTKQYGLNQLVGQQLLILSQISNGNEKISYLNEALKYSLAANDKSTAAEIYLGLGQENQAKNRLDDAEKFFLKGIELIENRLTTMRNFSDIQISFLSDKNELYKSLIDIYIEKNKTEEAFNLLEKFRSRNTNYNITSIKFSRLNDKEFVNKYFDLNWEIKNGLLSADERDSIMVLYSSLENQIQKKYPGLIPGIFENEINFSFKDSNNYFIEYYVTDKNSYAFLISSLGFELKKLNADSKSIHNLISQISPFYNDSISDSKINFNKDLFAFNASAAYNFYNNLVRPVIATIPENSKLIFSLPRELVKIPFEFLCLNAEQGKSIYANQYLIEKYSISYSPSFSIWKELQARPANTDQTALLAGAPNFQTDNNSFSETRGIEELDLYSRNLKTQPLKYSSEEISNIDQFFSDDIVLTDDKATETNFKKNAELASIIHLSTHSFLYNNSPVVIFAEDDSNDGYLETGEVAGLNLQSNLVVMSSCKSGLGKTDNSEGIIGMQKVLFDAGASSVVLSLWDVSDKQTTKLMSFFYEYLSSGITSAEALRKAKAKFIKNVSANPYFWAAFTLSGNSQIINIRGKSYLNYYLLFAVIGLLFTAYILRKKLIH